ncbi:alpha-L-rhamnosidase, partial [hydrothermal vent metagenome]
MKNAIHYIFGILGVLLLIISCQEKTEPIQIVNLRCENRVDPLGIDNLHPKFSWNLTSEFRNKKQTAYQILISDSKENLDNNNGNYWDSKKIKSDRSIQVAYQGKNLTSELLVYWKIRIWDEKGKVSEWSEPAQFEMGLLDLKVWQGQWISDGKREPENLKEFYETDPAPYFRKPFTLDKKVKKARLYITGIGYYEASINGLKIGDHVLDPGWTNYDKRILYSTYDVTDKIVKGGNCIGVELGNGWYNPLPMLMFGGFNLREDLPVGRPKFIAQLHIEYTDGSKEKIISDKHWKTHEGPIQRNNIFLGEIYDARKEIKDWNLASFDDIAWAQAKEIEKKGVRLQAQNQPPIKIKEQVNPIKVTEIEPDVFIFDMGENFAGWVKLKINADAGTSITLRYGELINKDGSLNPMTSVAGQVKGRKKDNTLKGGPSSPEIAWQSDTYIAKGEGVAYYQPKFTFHAFRYVEVS